MNILNKLTIKNLKLNKKRTFVTILGISLSVALICSITTFVTSMQASLINQTKQTEGDYEIKAADVDIQDKKYITSNVQVKEYMCIQNLGYSKLENSINKYKPYLYLIGADYNSLNKLGFNLIEGRMPQNTNEIVISQHLITNGGIEYKVGEEIELNVGERVYTTDGSKLTQNNPIIVSEKNKDVLMETIKEAKTQKYKIVGVISRPNIEDYFAPGYTVLTAYDDTLKDNNLDIYFKTKNIKDTYKFGSELEKTLQESNSKNVSINYNNELLRFMGVTKSFNIMTTLVNFAAIVIFIIVITSIFVIRNSFSISLTERLKQYGMLASIGATSKQIKKSVLFEGFLLAIISIPIGIIVGIAAISIVLIIVKNILNVNGQSMVGFDIIISVPIIAVITAVLISIFTIYISTLLPAIKASKISAIDAIRQTNEIKLTKRKLKTSKLLNKMFGIQGTIASKNLKRSKKKYRTTVVSLVVSIVLFLSMSTVINYSFKLSNLVYEEKKCNMSVYMANQNDISKEEVYNFYEQIRNINNVKRTSMIQRIAAKYDVNNYASERIKDILKTNYEEEKKHMQGGNLEHLEQLEEELKLKQIEIISLGEDEYKRYLSEIGLKENEVKDGAILYDYNIYNNGDKRVEYNGLNVNKNDVFEFSIYNNSQEENKKIKIIERTNKLPMAFTSSDFTQSSILIVSDELIKEYNPYVSNIYIDTSNPQETKTLIENIDTKIEIEVFDYTESVRENNAMVLVISIFLYGFIAIISIIGITNIFNTITTNMTLRNREFAILKSVGMNDKEFKKMINYESLLYGLKALLIGLPIGIILSFIIFINFQSMYSLEYFNIPFLEIFICIAFVFLIIFMTMGYSIKKIKNQNIIETIREENT